LFRSYPKIVRFVREETWVTKREEKKQRLGERETKRLGSEKEEMNKNKK